MTNSIDPDAGASKLASAQSQQLSRTLPDASFTLYTYDNAHRLTDIEDGEGNRIEYTLGLAGNRTAENVYDPSSALARTRTQVFTD